MPVGHTNASMMLHMLLLPAIAGATGACSNLTAFNLSGYQLMPPDVEQAPHTT